MKFRCTACGQSTDEISPLGPEGIVICEDCARTDRARVLLEDVRQATLAACALPVSPDHRVQIASAAKAERDQDWFDAVQNTTGKRPASRLEAMDFIRNAINK